MGKGDKKTKRGKIYRGTYGVTRPRIKKKVKPETKINVDKGTVVSK
ncbi:30S ribosomal protein THX [Formosa sp. A9]